MEDIYTFKVDNETFEKVLNGKKTIQLVLNDSKHKAYAVGNQITFLREESSQPELDESESAEKIKTISATITNLLYFADVTEAVTTLGKEACGFKQSATTEKASDLFLSSEPYDKVEKNGLVALIYEIEKA